MYSGFRNSTLIFLCVLLASVALISQDEFSDDELRKFAEVYVAQKAPDLACEGLIQHWIVESGVPMQRYGEILRAQIAGEKPDLSKSEKQVLDDLHAFRREVCRERHIEAAVQLCATKDLEYMRYEAMLTAYNTRIAFQHRVRPYIMEVMQIPLDD